MLLDFDLLAAERHVIEGCVAMGAVSAKAKPLSLLPTLPVVAAGDAPIVADLYDRLAICRMVQSDFELAAACLAREAVIRPPGKRPDGHISAIDDLQAMCAAGRLPVVLPQLVMNNQPRMQLLLFMGGFQTYTGDLTGATRLYRLVVADRAATAEQVLCARYELAEIERLEGRLTEACATWDALAKAAPRSMYAAQCLRDAALVFAGMGDIPKSTQRMQQVIAEYPAYPERYRVLYNLGFIYYFTNDYPKAQIQFKKLAREFPETWEAQRVKRVELPAIQAVQDTTRTK